MNDDNDDNDDMTRIIDTNISTEIMISKDTPPLISTESIISRDANTQFVEVVINSANPLFASVVHFIDKTTTKRIEKFIFANKNKEKYDDNCNKFNRSNEDELPKDSSECKLVPYIGEYEVIHANKIINISIIEEESQHSYMIILKGERNNIIQYVRCSVIDNKKKNEDINKKKNEDIILKFMRTKTNNPSSSEMLTIYKWNKSEYPLDTLLLPQTTKDKLIKEINDFYCEDAKMWSKKLGVCHYKTYLFHSTVLDYRDFEEIIKTLAGVCNKNIVDLSTDSSVTLNSKNLIDEILYYILPSLPEIYGDDPKNALSFAINKMEIAGHIIIIFTDKKCLYDNIMNYQQFDYEIELYGIKEQEIKSLLIKLYDELADTEILNDFISKLCDFKFKISPIYFKKLFLKYRKYTGPQMLDEILNTIKNKFED